MTTVPMPRSMRRFGRSPVPLRDDVAIDEISVSQAFIRVFLQARGSKSPDYVTSGDERSKNVTSKLINFFNNAAGGRPERIQGGYRLDGAATAESDRRLGELVESVARMTRP